LKMGSDDSGGGNGSKGLLMGRSIDGRADLARALDELNRDRVILKLSPGEVVSSDDMEILKVGYVMDGSISRKVSNGGNRYFVAAIMVSGDLIGIDCLFESRHSQCVYISREATRLCLFPSARVREVMEISSQLAESFLEMQSRYVQEFLSHMQVMSNKSLRARVAAGILYFNGKLGSRPWTNKELAAWAGVTQEGVGRCFTDFLAKGMVRKTGRRTQIQNRQVLEEIASEFKDDKAPHLVSYLVSEKDE
jgi:CRP-like cAMP-binding protein